MSSPAGSETFDGAHLDAVLRDAVEDQRPGKHLDVHRALERLTDLERAVLLARAHGIPWHAIVEQVRAKGHALSGAALREVHQSARAKVLEVVGG